MPNARQTYSTFLTGLSIFAFLVALLGAYTRLKGSGLGCPDWPGCYGHLIVPSAQKAIDFMQKNLPHSKLVPVNKAWPEMIHRYFAGGLSLGILLMFAWHIKAIRRKQAKGILTPFITVLLLGLQALLGMWTVTWLLYPLSVSGHLLVGTLLTASIWIHRWQQQDLKIYPIPKYQRILSATFLLLLIGQFFLGGWTASNYASLACSDFPLCQGSWWPHMDFSQAFTLLPPIGPNYEGGISDMAARTAIHMSHRIGAAIISLLALILYLPFLRQKQPQQLKQWAGISLSLLLVQMLLGMANVLGAIPLAIAVAHNGVGILLLLSSLTFFYMLNTGQPYARTTL